MRIIPLLLLWGRLTFSGVLGEKVFSLASIQSAGEDPNLVQELIEVGGLVFPATCHQALLDADTGLGSPGFISPEEYVTFGQLLGPPGVIDDVEQYVDLPIYYIAAFTSLACLCDNPTYGGDPTDTGCCLQERASIRIPAPPGPDQSTEDFRYLYVICGLTDEAAKATLANMPTPEPTLSPTLPPTPSPTLPPTKSPISVPTPEPTAVPTRTPTPAPTVGPTMDPTLSPTSSPTLNPISMPTMAPVPPESPTSAPVTESPTTLSPTLAPVVATDPPTTNRDAAVSYDIAVTNFREEGDFIRDYLADLQVAMDRLAQTVEGTEFGTRRLRRRLEVVLQLPTGFDESTPRNIDCPPNIAVGVNETCQSVTAEMVLTTSGADDADGTAEQFENALFAAISNGDLQEELESVNENSPVRILTGMASVPKSDDSGLSGGATAGIVIGALLLGIIPVAMYLVRRGQKDDDSKPDAGAFQEFEGSHSDVKSRDGMVDSSVASGSIYTDNAHSTDGTPVLSLGTGFIGGEVSNASKNALSQGEDAMAEPALDHNTGDSSSNAGSSGWSSSAGISSLNTGSLDDSMDAAAAAGTSLAAIGATSALAQKLEAGRSGKARRDTEEPDVPAVSREQLDSLIESGDWAAVGATAALLAAASDSQSNDTRSKASRSRVSKDGSSLDAKRAAELDNLVDAGDWEGVVFAAAKFEAESESSASGHASSANSSSSYQDDTSATGTPSGGGTSMDAARKAEIRKEVEALVQRVVPEEMSNVDEMMNQFEGREEELLETLRTMYERDVAKKARQTRNKSAKIEARKNVQRGVVPGAATTESDQEGGAGVAAGAALAGLGVAGILGTREKDTSEHANESFGQTTTSSDSVPSALDAKRSTLEKAIEEGDWDAVGQAAAMMSDASSATTASTNEINRLASASMSVSSKGSTGITEYRAAELDTLIERGNWSAVVDAANRYSADDKTAATPSKEEEEALAQAEVWMKIAEQKKKEGATDEGASDAAEWAISRSLSQLKEAERKAQGKVEGEDEV